MLEVGIQTTLTEYLSSRQESRTHVVSVVIVWRRYRETKSSLSHILPSVTVHWCVLRAEGGRVGGLLEIIFCVRGVKKERGRREREYEREREKKEERENSGWSRKMCPTCPKYDTHIMHACTCTTNTLQVRSKMMYALGGPLKFSKHTKK